MYRTLKEQDIDRSRLKALRACKAAYGKKAEDVVLLEMTDISGFCDYFVIASASSTRRVQAISDSVKSELCSFGCRAFHKEGTKEDVWALLDFEDVVIHIFHKDVRGFYDLERLWNDAPKENVDEKWLNSELNKI